MNIAVILAGGVGTRMRSDGFPKQYVEINDKPILVYTLQKFQTCDDVDKIVVVAHDQWQKKILQWTEKYDIDKMCCIAPQGSSRQESVYNGLKACLPYSNGGDDYVLIHDAARPLVTPKLISESIAGAQGHDGCLPVIPMKDTIYVSHNGSKIHDLTDRSTLFCGQSPEVMRLCPYLEICEELSPEQMESIRGSCELAFQKGFDIAMIPGEETNFKLTTADDLGRLRRILEE